MAIHFAKVASQIPPNVFERMDRKVLAARGRGVDVIDLSKGNPDGFPEEFIREVTRAAVDDPLNARYTPFDASRRSSRRPRTGIAMCMASSLMRPRLFAVEGAVDGLADLFSILLDEGDAVAFATRTTPPTIAWPICGARMRCCFPRRPSWVGCRTSMRCLLRCGMA